MKTKIINLKDGVDINKLVLESDAVANLEMKKDSILYVDIKSYFKTTKPIQKQIWLSDLIENYQGPAVYLDVDEDGKIVGIEIN